MASENPNGKTNNNLKTPPKDPWLRRMMQREYGAGKGDGRRPEDKAKFDAGYERAFGRCSEHPTYQAIREPTADCAVCRRLWREARLKGSQ